MRHVAIIWILGSLVLPGTGVEADVWCSGEDGGTGNLANVKLAMHAELFNDLKACGNNAPGGFACNADTPGFSNLDLCVPVNTRASVYVIALDIPSDLGLKGATFGVDFFPYNYATYTGIYAHEFNLCVDLSFPSVPPNPRFPGEPESGVVVTSVACLNTVDSTDPQGEGYAILGWFDVTSYDYTGFLSLTPRLYLSDPDFQVADCDAVASDPCYPSFAATLGFGGFGYDPCYFYGIDDCFLTGNCPSRPPSDLCGPVTVKQTSWSAIKRRAP